MAAILGIATDGLDFDDPDTWPKTLQEIVDRTNNLSEASRLLESSSGTGKSLEQDWLDFLSNWDELADNVPLASLSQAINQGPTGFASAELPSLVAGEEASFLLTPAQLSEGFVDPDGDVLAVTSHTTNKGAWFTSDGQGNWVLDPGAAGDDPAYLGPLELSYLVSEAANGGTVPVQATINFSLTDDAAVENLTLTGSSATTASGDGLNNIITGNSAANTITGLEGNDTLAGGQGNDTLTGGSGSDLFRFDTTPGNANRDLITDFSSGSVQRFLYDSSAGILQFDRDGNGSTYMALDVANLGASTFLAATDFILG